MVTNGFGWRRFLAALPSFYSSIKGRVVLAVSILVIVGLGVSDVVGIVQLHSYLAKRVDNQINSALRTTSRIAQADRLGFAGPTRFRQPNPSRIQAPSPVLIVVYGPSGNQEFVRYNQLGSIREPVIPSLGKAQALSSGKQYFRLPGTGNDSSPFQAKLRPLANGSGYVLVAVSLDEVDSTISHLGFLDAVVGGIVVLALVVLTYLAVWLGMRPLSEMEDAADAIARGDLSRRIDTATSSEEINKLAMAFNQMLERIQSAFIQVQESERLSKDSQDQLRRFVSNAGHELRTPLTSILGYSELLQSGIDSDMELVKGASRRIQQESQRMSGLVEELLLLASLDQRKPLRFERVDVLALVADGVQDARVIQPSRDIRLQTLHGNDDGSWVQPLLVAGDEQSLRQVISNLINNALFHTPIDSGIIVRLGISDEFSEIGPEVVVIEVEDYGPGIKEDAVVHLFERFYRVDDNRGYHNGGFGLGLSVVDSVVRAHGGSVSVDSVVGRGSRFTVVLPSFSPDNSKSEALHSGVNPL